MSKLPGKMTRKQHWVPRFYLRYFADSSGQLHAYSRQKGSFFRTNCENLCSMRDLYEVEHADATGDATDRFYAQNLIEVKLSELESRIAPLYDRFLERQKEDQCEDEGYSDGKAAVCELAANIIVRHPISMRVDKKWSRETAEELLRNVHLTPYELGLLDWSDWRGDSQAVVELAAAATMLFSNDDIVPVNRIRKAFFEKSFSILRAPVGSGFVTTSMPMFIIGPEDDSYDFHLAYMPLSSEYAAVFSDDPLFPPFARLGFSGVEFMNRLLLLNCEHWDVAISRGSGPLEHAVRDWSQANSAEFMHEMFTRDGRELSLDAVIYDRSKEKEQTMLDAIDRGCLEGGYLDDEDLRIIFEHLLGRRRQGPGTLKGQAAY